MWDYSEVKCWTYGKGCQGEDTWRKDGAFDEKSWVTNECIPIRWDIQILP